MEQRISVVLAVYNEEQNLENCLNSVSDLAWEIVIVDGGSTDKTVEIAKKFKSRIIHTKNQPNFHINKNKGIDEAKGDWILQLDADETVTNELKKEINEVLSSKPQANGFWIPRKNFFLDRFLTKGGQYPDYTLRLYRKDKGRLPAKDVHEQARVEGSVGYLKNDLLHTRDKNFSIYINRFNRYTDLLSTQLQQAGLKVTPYSFINYLIFKPSFWFLKSYLRNRGYVDGFPGFIFALFSSLRFPVSFLKLWGNYRK